MNISVVGPGRWGSFIAWYLDKIGHVVCLYGRKSSANMAGILTTKMSGTLLLPDSVALSTEISSVQRAEIVVISIGSQGLRALAEELLKLNLCDKILILCMKGIEIGTGKRLTEIVGETVDSSNRIAVWLGPGHVQEFSRGIPNCMVIDSENEEIKDMLVDALSSDLIRFYYGQDLVGNEIGAAAKNVIGIAAGMLDGLQLSTLKGALMSRGTREIARLIKAMGGNEKSAYGLCHLGDYEATVFSKFSHNRLYGELLVRGEPYDSLAEGADTVKALMVLEARYAVELPICRAVYSVLYAGVPPKESIDLLFSRSIKNEFYE